MRGQKLKAKLIFQQILGQQKLILTIDFFVLPQFAIFLHDGLEVGNWKKKIFMQYHLIK